MRVLVRMCVCVSCVVIPIGLERERERERESTYKWAEVVMNTCVHVGTAEFILPWSHSHVPRCCVLHDANILHAQARHPRRCTHGWCLREPKCPSCPSVTTSVFPWASRATKKSCTAPLRTECEKRLRGDRLSGDRSEAMSSCLFPDAWSRT